MFTLPPEYQFPVGVAIAFIFCAGAVVHFFRGLKKDPPPSNTSAIATGVGMVLGGDTHALMVIGEQLRASSKATEELGEKVIDLCRSVERLTASLDAATGEARRRGP